MSVEKEVIKVAFDWFESFAQTEKKEIETLFSNLTKSENITLRKSLASIFSLDDDKWSMLDILDGTDVLLNTIAICLRSIKNGNNLDKIIENIPFDCVKYAFLITKRHLILYYKIETQKEEPFFRNSSYQSIYGFCKIFSVDNKLSVLLMNKLGVKDLSDWLDFDTQTTQTFLKFLNYHIGVHSFQDVCLLLSREPEQNELLTLIRNTNLLDKRLEFKVLQLKKVITRFARKWDILDL